MHALLEMLRQQGELFLIGAEVSMLESRDRRVLDRGAGMPRSGSASSASQGGGSGLSRVSASYLRMPPAQVEMHLQVRMGAGAVSDACVVFHAVCVVLG